MELNRKGKSAIFQTILSSVIFFGTIVVVIMLVAFKSKPQEETDSRQAPLVEWVLVDSYQEDIKINVTGVALPFREINISAEVTGSITEKTDQCRAGRYVDANTHLLSIDSKKYSLGLQRAKSEVAESEARLKKVEVELKGAEEILELLVEDAQYQSTEKEKREQLFKENAVSETELTKSRRDYIAARNAEKTQRNRVETLKADKAAQQSLVALKNVQVEEAQVDFEKAIIKAPAKGVIISDDVQKDDFVQTGKSLLVFEDTSAVEIRCDLRSDQLQAILETKDKSLDDTDRFKLPSLDAKITYESDEQAYQWTGKLDRYDGLGLNERTRTAPCRIVVENTSSTDGQRALVRGMYVSIELNLGKKSGLLVLPSEAVRAGNVVWILASDKLKKQKIKILNRVQSSRGGERVIVKAKTDWLNVGDKIIVSPIPQPVDGMKLRSAESNSGKPTQVDSSQSGKAVGERTESPIEMLQTAGGSRGVRGGVI